jgi:FkbM family methyltransferase
MEQQKRLNMINKVKHIVKHFLIKIIPNSLKKEISKSYNNGSAAFSQEGEDLLLERIFDRKRNGTFVDVGAHHPTRFSNTYRLYLNGWRGINLDALPGSMTLFNKERPEDINLEIPVSDKEELLTFYIFNEPALNTFSKEEAEKKAKIPPFYIKEEITLKTKRLEDILDEYYNTKKEIDLLSVDAEGFDLQVLKSNNWEKYRPLIVVVEGLNGDLNEISNSELYLFFKSIGYKLLSKLHNSQFYINNNI